MGGRKDDYEVGYGKPPVRTRFKKGKSGNPQGRVKGNRNLKTDFGEEMGQRVRIVENGRSVLVTKQQAMIKALVHLAVKGNTKAISTSLDLMLRLFGDQQMAEPADELSAADQAIFDSMMARTRRKGHD